MTRMARTVRAALLAACLPVAASGTEIPDLEQLIAQARTASPELAVAALESDAAAARVAGAGSLPDPKLQWQAMDIPRDATTDLPAQFARTDKIFLQQEFPLWGKRDLRRDIAMADAGKAAALKMVAENELVARIKAAYAEYHQVQQAGEVDRALLPRLSAIARVAAARYAQGVGNQQEATGAEIERAQLAGELASLEGLRRSLTARLNTLVGRSPSAAVVETPHARPIPDGLALETLTDRAARFNPDLKVEDWAIDAAERTADLADRGRYPDIAVSVGAVTSFGRFSGYEGMLEVTLPIRGDLHDAEVGEAKAMSGAAQSRRQARELAIEGDLTQAYWALQAAIRMEKVIVDSAVPQARIGFESALHAYEVGKGDFTMVLSAEQQWRKAQMERLKAELEQQLRLAEIEKLVGGEL
jgi:outer membrane protein TolC